MVVDMKLVEAKDALPEGYTPVEETLDTSESTPPLLLLIFLLHGPARADVRRRQIAGAFMGAG